MLLKLQENYMSIDHVTWHTILYLNKQTNSWKTKIQQYRMVCTYIRVLIANTVTMHSAPP